MDYSVLKKCILFIGIPAKELRNLLREVPHHIQSYKKNEIVFHLMDQALRVGIILEGCAEAQKFFPNGGQMNVSVRRAGEIIGPAAVFSKSGTYPCNIVSLEATTVMMFQKEDFLSLLQKDVRILQNFMTEIASMIYFLQQRLELQSYRGIAQKAALWLLMQASQTGKKSICIPGSISRWAMLINVSRPSLHRELKKLEEQGIISCKDATVTIRNAEALQDVLSR
ncbi:MAG: Crp/Fnr family transcriptional regulator [Oscillospiraceae bacterium]|nr:Crp/Fnr family transcriptional regulator [Oscillospiraceae bacterium]